MVAFQSDSVNVWAWNTQRYVTVTVSEEASLRTASAMLTMPAAREMLNALTAAIAEIDSRDNSEDALAALRIKLGC